MNCSPPGSPVHGILQARILERVARRNSNNLRYADDTTLMPESKEELKSFLMKVKEESEKASLKLNIQKTKIIASCPITSWQIHAEKVERVADFIFLGSKITVDGDCSHGIKRCLLKRKAVTNLDNILKSRGITLLTKVCIMKAVVSQQSGTDMKAGPYGRWRAEELMFSNCSAGEDS